MPGGMGGGPGGGIGGLAGMLMRSVAGGGGPGGMGGPGGASGTNGQDGKEQNSGSASDVYDVDRWKRADDLDSGYLPTMVQTVRDAWERETEEKKKHSPIGRIRSFFQRKGSGESRRSMKKRERKMERRAKGSRGRQDDYEKDRSFEDAERERESARERARSGERPNRIRSDSGPERPRGTLEGNTIITPGMQKAVHHIPVVFPDDEDMAGNSAGRFTDRFFRRAAGRSPIGLGTRAGIDSFFSSSPLNSTLLAVDSLSFGPLTLNQVRQHEVGVSPAGGVFPSVVRDHHSEGAGADLPSELPHGMLFPADSEYPAEGRSAASHTGEPAGGSNSHSNLITEHTGASYMNALREHREQRKYDVRMRDH